MNRAIFLLRVELDGMEPMYFAEEPCAPEAFAPHASARTLQHIGTLQPPDFSEAISWGSSVTGPITGSATIRADLSPQRGWQQLHFGEHHRLDSMTAELSLWTRGTPYDQRVVQVYGQFLIDQIPTLSRPLTGTITQRVLDKAEPLPPVSAVTSTTTFPDLPVATGATEASNTDIAYPLWIGSNANSVYNAATDFRTSCIKCVGVSYTDLLLLVSYGALTPTTCIIRSVANFASPYTAPLTVTTDSIGNIVTIADITASGWVYATVDDYIADEWYVIWIEGGQAAYDHSGPLLGLGETIAWLLTQRYSPARVPDLVDLSAWAAVRPVLDEIRVGVLAEGGDPWDTVLELLKLAPGLFILAGPTGLRPVLVAPEQYTVLSHLLVANRCRIFGPDLFRMSGQQAKWVGANIVNAVTVSYVRRLSSGAFLRTLSVGPDTSPVANASDLRYGPRSVTLELPYIWSDAVAAFIANQYLLLAANQPTQDTWFAPLDVAIPLRLGSQVQVRDDQAAYADRAVWIVAREAVHVGASTIGFLLTTIDFS